MSLSDRLSDDLKLAMKARDQLRMDAIRMAKAALLNKEIELKKDLDETEMNRVLMTMVKQRKESVEQYQKGRRDDLADKELKEIAIIEAYLPKALSQEELTAVVEGAIREAGPVARAGLQQDVRAESLELHRYRRAHGHTALAGDLFLGYEQLDGHRVLVIRLVERPPEV